MHSFVFALFCSIAACWTILSNAATINVPADRSTIKAAVAAAASGDVILLAPGTYNENGIVINKSNITVASRVRTTGDRSYINSTILSGGGATIFDIPFGSGVGFELEGVKVINAYKPVVADDRISIKNNYFYDNSSDTISFEANGHGYVGYNQIELAGDDGIDVDCRRPGTSFKIEHNIVRNSGDDGIEIRLHDFSGSAMSIEINDNEFSRSDEDGIQLIDYAGATPRTFKIYRNILANNAMAGLGSTAAGNTVENYNGSPMVELVQFMNNTVVGNRVGVTGGDNIIAINNLIAHNSTNGVKFLDGNSQLSYSLVFDNGVNFTSTNIGQGVIAVDPMLDPLTFQLKTGSPAIDRGISSSPFIGTFIGSAPDLGAKEFGGVVDPTQNQAPVVDAGSEQTVFTNQASLSGSAADDGLPNGSLEKTWALVSGPAPVSFSSGSSTNTLVQFSLQGTYRLRLTANDGSLSASDDVVVRYANAGTGSNSIINSADSTYIEAENFAYSYGSLSQISDAAASSSLAMQAPVGQGVYAFTEHRLNMAAASATYYIFVRARSGSASAGALDVSVNNSAMVRLTVPNNSYSWIKLPVFVLEAGNWPMITKAASEGVVFDRIAISTSASFDPAATTVVLGPFNPVADSMVSSGAVNTNYGTQSKLYTDLSPTQQSYLRFTVPSFSGVVLTAKLRIYVTNGSGNGPKAFLAGNSWTETGITYSNRPGNTSAVLDDKASVAKGWVEYNVVSAVRSAGTYTFALIPDGSDGMDFDSRQGTNRPQLILTVNSGSTPPPPPATPTASLTANPTTIAQGGSSSLILASSNVSSCTGSGFATGGAVSGTFSVSPAVTTSYSVSCTGSAGSATSNATITVTMTPPPPPAYVDDSQSTLNRSGNKVVLSESYGYTPYTLKGPPSGTTVDARSASFLVANSKNSNPTSSNTCSSGSLQTNPYPIQLIDSSGIGIVGALVNGQVPMQSDWEFTYCNSASIRFANAPNAIVDNVRVTRSWDSIRFSSGSGNWTIKDSFVSESHDDCIENDEGRTGLVKDTLFDGCYMGLSMAPGNVQSGGVVTLDGVLMKMKAYLTEGAVVDASPFKFDETSNKIIVKNTIIAYDNANLKSTQRTQRAWNKMQSCSNNLILWLPDQAMPSDYPTPPSCFQIIKGQAARDLWTRARQNWINCHPKTRLASGDVAGNASQCDPTFWGGKN
jgi:hypothetical protein